MGDMWITDMKDFEGLFEASDGAVRGGAGGAAGGAGVRRAQYFGSIVSAATSWFPDEAIESALRCRRRPGRRRCAGYLQMIWREEEGDIQWGCPECDDRGVITGWQGTRWDYSGVEAERRADLGEDWPVAMMELQEYEEVVRCELGPADTRVLLSAQHIEGEILVAADEEEFERLAAALERQAARCRRRGGKGRLLTVVEAFRCVAAIGRGEIPAPLTDQEAARLMGSGAARLMEAGAADLMGSGAARLMEAGADGVTEAEAARLIKAAVAGLTEGGADVVTEAEAARLIEAAVAGLMGSEANAAIPGGGKPGRATGRVAAMVSPRTDRFFEFEVSLRGVAPRIWRSFRLHGDATFQDLHEAIQDACGWQDYHLFSFYSTRSGRGRTLAASSYDEEMDAPPAGLVLLSEYFTGPAPQACRYVYDYGDDWQHDVILRGMGTLDRKFGRELLDGARAFPPEDCGGEPGYERMVEFTQTGRDPFEDRGVELKEWLGDWDPERFDLEAVKKRFDR